MDEIFINRLRVLRRGNESTLGALLVNAELTLIAMGFGKESARAAARKFALYPYIKISTI